MKIKFLESCSGNGVVYREGEVYDLPKSEADGFIRSGIAELNGAVETRPLVQELKKRQTRPVKR
jgi:hypothetical protein